MLRHALRLLLSGLALSLALRASAATLLRTGFETTNPWPALAATQSAAGGTVTASATHDLSAGTLNTYGTNTASGGLLLAVNSSAATGAWTATLDSGVLSLLTANTRGLGFLTLAFSLEATSAYPVRVRIESYNSSSLRTGGLQTLIYPAAGEFYQRYALDLDKMTPDGPGAFVPTDPKVRIFFELDSTANGTGWPAAAGHALKIDNINYSTPKYYVKPASLGGSNSNDGLTEATALASVQAAVNKTFSGDNIIAIMEDATPGGEDYVENNFNGDMVLISKPGAPDAWIVFKNYPGHAPVMKSGGWDVFRICNNSSGGSAAYIEVRGLTTRGHSFVDANGDRQINPAFQQYVGLVDSRSNGNGISVDISFNSTNLPHNIRIADCTMEFHAGTNGGSGDRQTFENNIIRNNAWWMRYAGSGISFAFAKDTETNANPAAPTYRRLIRNNIIYGNECMVPWNRGTSNPYSDGNGIIIDSDTAGYTGKTLISNNLVFNNGGSGIHVLKAANVDIVHNTVYHNSASTSQAYGQIFTQSTGSTAGSWIKNVRVTNNIMVAQRNPTGVNSYLYNEAATGVATFDPTTITHNRNVYIGGDVTPPLSGANLSNNTDLGRAYDAANLFVSPSIDPDVADFRLRGAAVTARNYGFPVGYRGVLDLANTPRSLTGATDTGVYQTPANSAYPPVFTPKSGNYAATQNVTLVSDTAGATLVYTTNGTTPTVDAAGTPTNGTLYTGAAIPVSTATTLKAIAWKSGLVTAPPSTARYTFQDLSAVPVTLALQYPSGTYPGTLFSQPLTRTPGAWMRLTTNGTNPTPTTGTPQEYRGVTVTDFAEIRYIAFKAGRANSPVLTGTYTVRASMGNLSDGTVLTPIGANNIRFIRVRTTNGFSAANIYARINGLTGNYRAALYDDTAGVPTTRLAVSSLVTNPATGWTAFPLASRVTLAVRDSSNATNYYWLAIWSDNPAAGIYATATGGTVSEAPAIFTTSTANSSNWPATVASPTVVAGTANY
ncbi:MAG: chitobiase/beta-hexosaminidase C-terminal domain-containing protein, partial [Burkholderiales bacterium]|nr:chitobiase/beta-hexosaminidase C-terminal domain-containing protein [Opitutaceae bacterium]